MTPHLHSTRTPSRYARAQHHPDPPTSDPSGHPRDKMFSPAHPSSRIGHARAGQARDAGVLERRSGRLLGPGVRRCRSRPRIAPGLRTPHRLRPLLATNGRAEFAHPERTRAVARPGPRRGSPHPSVRIRRGSAGRGEWTGQAQTVRQPRRRGEASRPRLDRRRLPRHHAVAAAGTPTRRAGQLHGGAGGVGGGAGGVARRFI